MQNLCFNKSLCFTILSGILFTLIFYFAYSKIPDNTYKYRDDGIITLSHAKNLADYGSISINPSGERIEGYSAPVQFGIYYILYKVFRLSYKKYMNFQTYFCTFLLGCFFIQFFKDNYFLGLLFSFLASIFLINSPRFFLWHGSGMENPITNVLFLISFYLLYKMFEEKRINYKYAFIVFLTSISRIELLYYILPILIIYSIYWKYKHNNYKGFMFFLIVIILWLSFNFLRYLYFGEIQPNTAFAQNISIFDRIGDLVSFSPKIYKESFFYSFLLFKINWGIILVITTTILLFIKGNNKYNIIYLLTYTFLSLIYLNPFLFGKSRIDPTRTTSHSVLIIILFLCIVLFQLKKRNLIIITSLILIVSFSYKNLVTFKVKYRGRFKRSIGNHYIGFDTKPFYKIRDELLTLSKMNDLFRPTVGIIDIGAISWHKDFNIVDFGFLGSHILAKKFKNKQLIKKYIFDYLAPDFIHLHNSFAYHYGFLLYDEKFHQLYEPVYEKDIIKKKKKITKVGLWTRKAIKNNSNSKERKLIDKLANSISIEVIKKDLNYCKINNLSPLYIIRTLYRFAPEFEKAEVDLNKIIKLFRFSLYYDYAKAVLTSKINRNWHKEVILFLNRNQ